MPAGVSGGLAVLGGVACNVLRRNQPQEMNAPVAQTRGEGSGLPHLPPGITAGGEIKVQMLMEGHGAAAQGSAPSGATSAAAPGGAQHDPPAVLP